MMTPTSSSTALREQHRGNIMTKVTTIPQIIDGESEATTRDFSQIRRQLWQRCAYVRYWLRLGSIDDHQGVLGRCERRRTSVFGACGVCLKCNGALLGGEEWLTD